jgi:hypothetical protein
MKRLYAVVSALTLLAGCAGTWPQPRPQAPDAPEMAVTPGAAGSSDAGGAPIQKIPFRTGVSSATVEKLARAQACSGGQGAGLITQAGPVEVYRMQCDNGKVFMARCELRQCRQM